MSSATRILRGEHENILRMVDVTEAVARRIEHGEASSEVLLGIVEFFSLYAHRLHRDKEEDLLFPLLKGKGVPESGGCIGVLLADHEEGLAAFQDMSNQAEAFAAGEIAAAQAWAESARKYSELLRRHVRREDEILFIMAERLLTDGDQQELIAAFTKLDHKASAAGVTDRLREIDELTSRILQARED